MSELLNALALSVLLVLLAGMAYTFGRIQTRIECVRFIKKMKADLEPLVEVIVRAGAYAVADSSPGCNPIRLRAQVYTDYTDKLSVYHDIVLLGLIRHWADDDDTEKEYQSIVSEITDACETIVKQIKEKEKADG
jgi:hypothetical protein